MPGLVTPPGGPAPQVPPAAPVPPGSPPQREVGEQDKALAADWHKRIKAAQKRHEQVFKQFEQNRKLLAGKCKDGKQIRANLHFANQAMLIPQIYAKDPEFAVTPTARASARGMGNIKRFAETAEAVLTRVLIKDGKLKKRMKAQLRSTYATAVGFLKASWQESPKTDLMIENRVKDTQDNIQRLEALRRDLDDATGRDNDLKLAQLRETLAGLQAQSEVSVAKGMALDFVMSEDLLILDETIRTFSDYESASALAQRVWLTKDKYKAIFGYAPEKAKAYREQAGTSQFTADDQGSTEAPQLFCVWEIWDQDSNRVFTVCDGEEGFCKPPESVNWAGERWYPFFGVGFNEIDGRFYPLSDVELTDPLVKEYNENRDDLVEDRRDSRPINIARKGGSLTDDDVQRIRNRKGADLIMVEGVGTNPISNDIFVGSLAKIDPTVYDTAPARADIEQIVGGGDAARGTVLKAKTATEAEIVSQGLRGRSQERQDTIEDMLSELGQYTLEVCLRRLSAEEVMRIAGEDAVWPQMDISEIFDQVSVDVRGGSTGRPDRLQEQDRWTKLLPVIQGAIEKVSELRAAGQNELAQAVIELTKETLKRFDERLELEQFLPPPPQEGQDDPAAMKQQLEEAKQQLELAAQEVKTLREQHEKGVLTAATTLATSQDPTQAIPAFVAARTAIETGEQPDMSAVPPPPPPEPTELPAEGGQIPPADQPPMGPQDDALPPPNLPPPPPV